MIIAPHTVKTTGDQLDILTTITEKELTANLLQITIGETVCEAESVIYDDLGYLRVRCTFPEIADPGEQAVTLTVQGFTGTLSGQLITVKPLTITDISYMQEMTATICGNTKEGVTHKLADSRDNKVYTVAKLDDGNCWMTQNLSIGGSEEITLDAEDTDIDGEFVIPAAQTEGKQGWNNNLARVYDPGDAESGKLYNWFTATAGTGVDGKLNADPENSICPRGWTLPSISQYESMLAAYGWVNKAQVVDILTTEPFNFTFSGGYYFGYGGTDHGEYWTSSPLPEDTEKAYYPKIESISKRVCTDNTKPRSTGSAVRCTTKKAPVHDAGATISGVFG